MLHNDKPLHQQPLVTPIGSGADKIVIYPKLELKGDYSERRDEEGRMVSEGKLYKLSLYSDEDTLGYMDFVFFNDRVDNFGKKLTPHVEIIDMHSSGRYRNIGTAMHEFAFKFSLDQGAKGQVIIEAVRDTHYFHYKNEFRLLSPSSSSVMEYYLKLAKALMKAGAGRINQNLGATHLSLSSIAIKRNIAKYGITNMPDLDPDEISQLESVYFGEKIIEEAKKGSLALKILLALSDGHGYGFRENEPKNDRKMSIFTWGKIIRKFKNENPSLFCKHTERLIDALSNSIMHLMPIDTDEKTKKLVLLVCGATILAMAYQDETYGKQEQYQNKLLYPDSNLQKILKYIPEGSESDESHFMDIGENALIHKTLPYDGIHPKFFPGLNSIAELVELLETFKVVNDKDTSAVKDIPNLK